MLNVLESCLYCDLCIDNVYSADIMTGIDFCYCVGPLLWYHSFLILLFSLRVLTYESSYVQGVSSL
jgi:hypothetical protein